MKNITAAAFDFGRVISLPQDENFMKDLGAIAGLPADLMETLVWEYRDDYDRGKLDGEDYYRIMLESRGLKPDRATLKKLLQADLDSWKNVNPGTVRLMEEVKAAGLKLGILSNMPPDFLAFARATLPVFGLPHRAVFSCEAGAVKPEEKIYRVLLAALDCAPEELVFFDDTLRNVDKAAELGIRAFLWRDPETAREELRRLGVIP
jgi:putative hydrolase of the HAD superfamily